MDQTQCSNTRLVPPAARERWILTIHTRRVARGGGLVSIRSHFEEFDIVWVSTVESCRSTLSWLVDKEHINQATISNVIYDSWLRGGVGEAFKAASKGKP